MLSVGGAIISPVTLRIRVTATRFTRWWGHGNVFSTSAALLAYAYADSRLSQQLARNL